MGLRNCILFLSVLLSLASTNLFSQDFANGDLEGPITGLIPKTWEWQNVPFGDPVSTATSFNSATADITAPSGPLTAAGICGNSQSGSTYISGLYSHGVAGMYHEGIMQTVHCFTIGQVYSLEFYQTVNMQDASSDSSGAWIVYGNNVVIGISAVSKRNLSAMNPLKIWEKRTLTFTATSDTIQFKFMPWDDDSDHENTGWGSPPNNGGLRMGIDNMKIIHPAKQIVGNDTSVCSLPFTINTILGSAYTYTWQDGSINPTFTANTAGTYSVVATNSAGCIVKDTLSISPCTSSISCSFQLENPDFENPDILAKHGLTTYAVVNESELTGNEITFSKTLFRN